MKKITKYLRIVGIIILMYILTQLEYGKLFKILKNIDLYFILLYILSYLTYFLIKIFRFKFILKHYGFTPSYFNLFGVTVESQYIAFITPSRLGDSVKILFLEEQENIPKRVSTMAYVSDRLQDLYYMGILGFLSFAVILNIEVDIYVYLFLFVVAIVYLSKNFVFQKVAKKFNISKFETISLKAEIFLFIVNTSIYLFYFLQYYFLAKSLGISIDFIYLSAVATIGALASILPISVSGLGVRESIFIYFLEKKGIVTNQAFLLSFLVNFGFAIFFIVFLNIFYRVLLKIRQKRLNAG